MIAVVTVLVMAVAPKVDLETAIADRNLARAMEIAGLKVAQGMAVRAEPVRVMAALGKADAPSRDAISASSS